MNIPNDSSNFPSEMPFQQVDESSVGVVAKKIVFSTKDSQLFQVSEKIARMFLTIDTMLANLHIHDDHQEEREVIPLANVDGRILQLVIEWARKHENDTAPVYPDHDPEDEFRLYQKISDWDVQFFASLDKSTLFELIEAANYLNVSWLFELACKTVANMIIGKSAQQIREEFNIENDFKKPEQAEARIEGNVE